MRLRIRQIAVSLEYKDEDVIRRMARIVGCKPMLFDNITFIRRSLDARAKNIEPRYIFTVEADLTLDRLPRRAMRQFIEFIQETSGSSAMPCRPPIPKQRPVIVGAGPAGLMAAYELAQAGARPILIERGDAADVRAPKVSAFWKNGSLDENSNALYGEGGAGLFSDGKLTARSKDRPRMLRFFRVLVDCGAPEDILIDAEPHVGSDALLRIVPRIRKRIIEMGGDVRFNACLERLVIDQGTLKAVIVNGETISCDTCVLAVGHSARDVYSMLENVGVELDAKPFAVGVRVEVPQVEIDRSQFGKFADNPCLGAASFRLTRRASDTVRACYSFCMCPGGQVIACASEPGMLTTNGMSYSRRSLPFGNAGFLVPVQVADYAHSGPLAGVDFQREMERRAFALGGSNYTVPGARLVDFLEEQVGDLPEQLSCTRAIPAEIRECLPDFVHSTLAAVLPRMLSELNSVQLDHAVIYAAETRSSSPVRILRNQDGQSANVIGLYPAGEGAGYAGGIVSSAIDGIRIADTCLGR